MKPRLFYLLLSAFLLNGSFVFGQSNTIKSTPAGNGPILSGLKIDRVNLVNDHGNLESLGISSMVAKKGQTVTTTQVRVDCYYNGKITQYKYNGKIYGAEYKNKNCRASCFRCNSRIVKMTAKIQAAGKLLTGNVECGGPFYHGSVYFKFTKSIPFKDVKLLSVTLEPVSYTDYEKELQQYEACLKKENEKEKKDPEKKETSTVDDDWWNGKNEEPEKRKIVLNGSDADWWNGRNSKEEKPVNKNVSDADFWNGKSETAEADKKKQNAFRVVNDYSQYRSNNEGKYSWVEDADGNIIIPKGKYYIESFEDGLAQVKILIRTDYYDFVRDKKVQLFESCYMDDKGSKLPPKTYGISFGHYYSPLVLWDAAMSRAEIEETKRKWKAKDKSAYQQLKSIYSAQGYDID
jgi:hypothetical protein